MQFSLFAVYRAPYVFRIACESRSFVVLDRWSCTLVFTLAFFFFLFSFIFFFSFVVCYFSFFRCCFPSHTLSLSRWLSFWLYLPCSRYFDAFVLLYRVISPQNSRIYIFVCVYISDNVCLFRVRAFTSKIQNTFFDKRLEKLVGLFIVYISIFVQNIGQRDTKKYRHAETSKITHTQMTDVNVFG